jgi:type II secretory pathway pseudopilin PulG
MRASHSHSREGLSLVEVLVAITILLVGVYAVARGFPQLLQTIESNKVRTERTRDARSILDAWVNRSPGLPFALTYDPDNDPDADPTTPPEPVDPTTGPERDRLNARDDMYRVVRETFALPRYVGPTRRVCVHVLELGPAYCEPLAAPPPPSPPPDYRVRPDVYELVPLRRADTSAGYRLSADEFDVARSGAIRLSPFVAAAVSAAGKLDPVDPTYSVDELLADYTWIDQNGTLHFASDVRLRIDVSGAPAPPVVNLVPINPITIDPNGYQLNQVRRDSVRLWWKNRFFLAGEVDPAAPAWSDPASVGRNGYQVDNVLVAVGESVCFTLAFNPQDATRDVFGRETGERILCADYYVATEVPAADDREERPPSLLRQVVTMAEDHQVPLEPNGTDDAGTPIYRVKLRAKFLDTTGPLPFAQAPGERVNILAIDLHDGLTYSDNVVLLPTQALATTIDLARIGEVFFYDTAPAVDPTSEHHGHKLRFYYRGEEEPTQRLQKAAATFVEGPTDADGDGFADYPDEVYREYTPDPDWDPTSGLPRDLSKLSFPRSCIGQAVKVDYVWADPDAPAMGPQRTTGELHLIAGDMAAPQNAVTVRLRRNPGANAPGTADGTVGNDFTVQTVIAVRGVSAKSVAWWRSPNGRLRHTEVSTYLTSPLG